MVNSGKFPKEPPPYSEGTTNSFIYVKRYTVRTRIKGGWYFASSHRWKWVARLEALGWEDAGRKARVVDNNTGQVVYETCPLGDDV